MEKSKHFGSMLHGVRGNPVKYLLTTAGNYDRETNQEIAVNIKSAIIIAGDRKVLIFLWSSFHPSENANESDKSARQQLNANGMFGIQGKPVNASSRLFTAALY
jgi:hypothetical protein